MVIAILQYWIIVSCNIGISLIESVSGKPADAVQCVLNEAEERLLLLGEILMQEKSPILLFVEVWTATGFRCDLDWDRSKSLEEGILERGRRCW